MEIELSKLADPFPPEDVEWRIGRAGKKGGKVWAKVLAYVESRAIMDRLDTVCGPENWQTRYTTTDGHITCEIGIRVDGEWIWKGDGAGYLEVTGGLSPQDAGKGDFSNALKRAGIEWQIGRYLYGLDEGWANVHQKGEHYGKLPKNKGGDSFRWDPPDLPAWALPGGNGKPSGNGAVNRETGEVEEVPPELVAKVRGLMDIAAKEDRLDEAQATRVEEALASGDKERIERALDWLRSRTPHGNSEKVTA